MRISIESEYVHEVVEDEQQQKRVDYHRNQRVSSWGCEIIELVVRLLVELCFKNTLWVGTGINVEQDHISQK